MDENRPRAAGRPDMQARQAQIWANWLGQLTGSALRGLTQGATPLLRSAGDESVEVPTEYREWAEGLPTSSREVVLDDSSDRESISVATDLAAFILIEAFDGEWPTVRCFRTPDGLVQRMSELEGQDVCTVPIMGIPLPFTRGPVRYLLLPDQTALVVPLRGSPPAYGQRVAASLVEDMLPQDDYFLGPSHLTQPAEEDRPSRTYHAPGFGPRPQDDEDDAGVPAGD